MPEAPKKQYDIVQLTSGRTLISTNSEGTMQAIKAEVELSMATKDIVVINDTPVITAAGFDKLNKVAGVSLVMPNRIDVPMHGAQPNPFFITDKDTGAIRFVMAKMSSIGYSPVGNLAVVDQTLLFDLLSYLKMDVLAKVKKFPGFGRVTHRDNLTPDEAKYGYFIPILDRNYGLWVDTRHTEFLKVISDHSQRQRFAERIALGILKRNCLRHHPAIGIMNVQMNQGVCHVPILAWRKDLSVEKIRKIAEDTGAREGVETVRSDVTTTDQLDASEAVVVEAEAIGDTTVETGERQVTEVPKTTGKPPTKREVSEIRIGEMIEGLGPEEWAKFSKKTIRSGRSIEQFTDDETFEFEAVLRTHLQKLGI